MKTPFGSIAVAELLAPKQEIWARFHLNLLRLFAVQLPFIAGTACSYVLALNREEREATI